MSSLALQQSRIAVVVQSRIHRAAFWLVTAGTLLSVLGLTMPHLSGQRLVWYDQQLRAATAKDVAQGRDPGPGPAVGLAIIEGTCCLLPLGVLSVGWLVLARDMSTAARPRWTPLDDWAGVFFYATLAGWCVIIGSLHWGIELGWAAGGEFITAVGYILALIGHD